MTRPHTRISDEGRQIVVDFAKEGLSQAAIAKKLGETRSAISGIIYRARKQDPKMRQTKIPNYNVKKPKPHVAAVPHEAKKEAPVAPEIRLEPLGAPNDILKGCCHWMDDDPTIQGWRMCGRPGEPWCDHHRKKVYTPTAYKDGRRLRGDFNTSRAETQVYDPLVSLESATAKPTAYPKAMPG